MAFIGGDDLKDHTGIKSSMRYNIRILVIVCSLLLISVGIYIIITAFNKLQIDGGAWAGMGSFVLGVGGLLTGILYNQKEQKKVELNSKSNSNNNNL